MDNMDFAGEQNRRIEKGSPQAGQKIRTEPTLQGSKIVDLKKAPLI